MIPERGSEATESENNHYFIREKNERAHSSKVKFYEIKFYDVTLYIESEDRGAARDGCIANQGIRVKVKLIRAQGGCLGTKSR